MTCSAPPDFPRENPHFAGNPRGGAFRPGLDLASLEHQGAEDAIPALCGIEGIGPWTAEVYLLFWRGRPDIFPAADLALQEAARLRLRPRCRPAPRDLRVMSDAG